MSWATQTRESGGAENTGVVLSQGHPAFPGDLAFESAHVWTMPRMRVSYVVLESCLGFLRGGV